MISVILLPGLACDDELFAHQAPALAALGCRVHISNAHTRKPSLPEMAAALLAEHPGQHLLVGASMGGMVALEMHRQAPERVLGLGLLGTTARSDTPELIALRTQACQLFAAGRAEELLRANVMFAFHPTQSRSPDLVARYLAMTMRAGADQLIAQNRAVMARADRRPQLPQVKCPVLVVCGEADQLTPPETAREMAALMPQAWLEMVPGAGHMLTMEQPQRVSDVLVRWVQSLS